ncbi:MAG: response regulator [Myxococcales bacterium]|nr:response regulator [Myxococcales bacterium]
MDLEFINIEATFETNPESSPPRLVRGLDSMGRVTGRLAHDLNNLLTPVLSYSRFVLEGLAPGDPRRDDLAHVLKAGDAAAKLTDQLLAFSQRRRVNPVLLDLNDVIEVHAGSRGGMLERTLGATITLEVAREPRPLPVRIDPSQLDQLLTHLALNARDAMVEGGTLRLSTWLEHCHGRSGLADGSYAVLRFEDDGVGLQHGSHEHLFEPFFTTKGQNRRGLGLSTCYGIVRQAGGLIDACDGPDQGAAFTIFLPCAASEHETTESPSSPEASSTEAPWADEQRAVGLRGMALVVEDQAPILQTISRSLHTTGLNVLQARSAEEALELVDALEARIDLLFTDVELPEMSGHTLAAQLRAHQPQLRVLFCSGFIGRGTELELGTDAQAAFLPKPFTGAQVMAKVAELMQRDALI